MRAAIHIHPPTDDGFVLTETRPGEFSVAGAIEGEVRFVSTSRYRKEGNRWTLIPIEAQSTRRSQEGLRAIEAVIARSLDSHGDAKLMRHLCHVLDKMAESRQLQRPSGARSTTGVEDSSVDSAKEDVLLVLADAFGWPAQSQEIDLP